MSIGTEDGVRVLAELLAEVATSRGYVENVSRHYFEQDSRSTTLEVRTLKARLGRAAKKLAREQRTAAETAFDHLADAMSAELAPHERYELAERNATMWTERMLAAKAEVDNGPGEAARRRDRLATYIMTWLRDRNRGRHAATIPNPDEEDHALMIEELRMILEHGGKPPNWSR